MGKTGPEAKTSPRRVLAREREEQALRLRIAGATYDQIAQALGVSRSAAHKIVVRVLDRLNKQIGEDAEQVRQLELERLNKLLMAIWSSAVGRGDLQAIDRVLKIIERRAKLLGLDAPERVIQSGVLQIVEEIVDANDNENSAVAEAEAV